MNTREHALQCFSIDSVGPLLDFRQALCRVANGELNNRALGICHNVETLGSRRAYVLVPFFAQSWPEYSGVPAYPIKSDYRCSKWQGPNLGARLSLIQHIITELDKYIEDYRYDKQNP